ncbi:Hypothetical protein R9X50_00323600 [Acrodontium crateriforme]|uniref:BTB domain-containing protein n=1 Tax=Acrodontium crateriforme TaxID=150365 RepID=A0AAQ3M2G9_9PEZI|nr:Hypothetical protein R9X50_00323600 [Acrodontium crateriforme]
MVSHHRIAHYAESPAATAPPVVHRASSVTSTARSSTRRHRHARSHHGGSVGSHSQNEFPVFSITGDVDIVIQSASGRRETRYVLHRLILSQCSGFFEAGMRAEWSGRLAGPDSAVGLARINENDNVTVTSSSRAISQERRPSFEQQPKKKWSYVLDWTATGDDEPPMLVQREQGPPTLFGNSSDTVYSDRPPPIRNKPPASNENFFRSMTNFSSLNLTSSTQPSAPAEPGDEVLKDYDNLFRTMYQYTPVLDSVNIATAYTECKALLHLADMYDALEIVGSRVDHHLLRFGARLFKQIAKYPPSYLKLGYLARSRVIFSEAMIHVVGQWPTAAPQLRGGGVDSAVMDLVEDKVDELRELEERVEAKLWRLTLTTSRGERVTPTNDYLSWLAISLFRSWFADNTTPALAPILKDSSRQNSSHSSTGSRPSSHSRHAPPSNNQRAPPPQLPPTGRVYRLLGSTVPTAYLSSDEIKRFLKSQPDLYSRDNLRRLERRVSEVKHLARDAVTPLMRNFLELDLAAFGPAGLGYLTCTRLVDGDITWE